MNMKPQNPTLETPHPSRLSLKEIRAVRRLIRIAILRDYEKRVMLFTIQLMIILLRSPRT